MTDSEQDDKSWIDIDPNRLDREWLLQPKLYMKYAEQVAEARHDYTESENKLEIVMAEVARRIRDDPLSHGVEKATVDAVKAAVTLHEDVIVATKRVNARKYNMELLQACIGALDQRKKALEALVQLRLADYFSEPRGPKGVTRDEVDAVIGPKQGRKERR